MINPSLVKTVGFIAAIVGIIGSAAVLFLPHSLIKWDKSVRIAFITIAFLGVISNRIGDYVISTANGPRNMPPAEWTALSTKMHSCAGEKFTILTYTDENEAGVLTYNLKACLDNAGWKYSDPHLGERYMGIELQGVRIAINATSDKKTKDAAQFLVNGLNKHWIWSRWSPEPSMQPNKISIHIFPRIRVY
jgi:hypothetical protein